MTNEPKCIEGKEHKWDMHIAWGHKCSNCFLDRTQNYMETEFKYVPGGLEHVETVGVKQGSPGGEGHMHTPDYCAHCEDKKRDVK